MKIEKVQNYRTLIKWLNEEEGWEKDIANDLAIEYENGISLLRKYKKI
jgi:hypothetical protein